VSDGGDEIGESCVRGGGVLSRRFLRPLIGALLVREGIWGLGRLELLLRGGAIVSLNISGVRGLFSIEGRGSSSGSAPSSGSEPGSSNISCSVDGIASSGEKALGDGKVGLDWGT